MKKADLEICKKHEKDILLARGFKISEIKIDECYTSESDYIHFVQIKKIKQTNKNVLLMAHGFMGSNIGFFKLYESLKNDFHIISIDIPGQGLSSSLKKTPKSLEAWIKYFLSNIKVFLSKMNINKFSIFGHSMGAYILTHFANKFPKMINDIYLLSPGGVNFENPDFEKKKQEMIKSKNCLTQSIAKSISNYIFKKKNPPMSLWFMTYFRSYLAKKVYGGKRLKLTKKEQKSFIPLYQKIYKSKPSTDNCLGYLFKEGPMSDKPLMDVFEKLHMNKRIVILYGRFDWMDFEYTKKDISKKKLNIDVDFVDGCDHQIVFQNPLLAGKMIIRQKKQWDFLEEQKVEDDKILK